MRPAEGVLSGRHVLLTREARRAASFVEALAQDGARATCLGLVQFAAPREPEPSLRAVEALAAYGWVVFTSATGVRFFLEACRARGVDPRTATARWAAVGPGTASALELAGLGPVFVADCADAAGLAEALASRIAPGDRLLWVRPERAARERLEALETRGARVEGVAFYRTLAAPSAVREAARGLAAGRFDAVLLTSPSSLEALLEGAPHCRQHLARMVRAALGRTSAAALEARGLPPHAVARRPDAEGVREALRRAFGVARGGKVG